MARRRRYEKNLSPRTLRAYAIDLRQLSAHPTGKLAISSILAVDKAALCDYIQALFGVNAEKTVKRKVATLKVFFHYLEREDVIPVNPLRMEVRIKETKRLPRTMPFPELKRLFRHLYEQKEVCPDRDSRRYGALVRDCRRRRCRRSSSPGPSMSSLVTSDIVNKTSTESRKR